MVLALIFAFLMGAAIIVLVTYLYKNQRLGLPLINKDVILSALLVVVLLFLTLHQYIIAILLFAAGGLLFLYFVKKKHVDEFTTQKLEQERRVENKQLEKPVVFGKVTKKLSKKKVRK